MQDFLIVGLGNPGEKYQNTRHNIGFRVLDSLVAGADFLTVPAFKLNKKLKGEFSAVSNQQKIYLLKPLSFMNLSGEPVLATLKYFKLTPTNLVVVHDDVDLPFGQIRLSKGAGSGGHNGVKSIIQQLASQDFIRLRIGIAAEPIKQKIPTEKFVLAKFSATEERHLEQLIPLAGQCLESLLKDGLEKTMSKFN